MRLGDKPLSFVVNFLLGVAWATAFLGAASAFFSTYSNSFFLALIYAAIATLPGFIAILLIEHFITSKEKHMELQKHTKLLEALLQKEKIEKEHSL